MICTEPTETRLTQAIWLLAQGRMVGGTAKLTAFAREVGAGPAKRVVLLLDNAGCHTRPNLTVLDGLTLVYLPREGRWAMPFRPRGRQAACRDRAWAGTLRRRSVCDRRSHRNFRHRAKD